MSTTSPDEERFLKELYTAGSNLLKSHPAVMDKLFDFFKSSRDISPDQDREISNLIGQLQADAKGSRDLPSDVDSERWLPLAIGLASSAINLASKHPGVVKSVWNAVSSFF
jgi:hypothetical protein